MTTIAVLVAMTRNHKQYWIDHDRLGRIREQAEMYDLGISNIS